MVKFIIGMDPLSAGGFQVLGSDGRDLSKEFPIISLDVHCEAGEATTATIKVYADVAVSVGDDRMDVKPIRTLTDR